jgi:hypothetical protein
MWLNGVVPRWSLWIPGCKKWRMRCKALIQRDEDKQMREARIPYRTCESLASSSSTTMPDLGGEDGSNLW